MKTIHQVKSVLILKIIVLCLHFLERMTMLDERFLSVIELQERQQEIQHNIKNIE